MRIAIFTDTFFPNIDGVVTSVLNLSRRLAMRGHSILILAPDYGDNGKLDMPKSMSVLRFKSIPLWSYKNYRIVIPYEKKCRALLGAWKPDIIHFMTYGTLGLIAGRCAKRMGIPLVGTFHTFFADPQYLRHIHMDNKYMHLLAWKYSKYLYSKCSLITAPSACTCRELKAQGFNGKIIAISNGIDTSIFGGKKSQNIRKKYGLKKDVLLFVGRIGPEKNIGALLDIFQIVAKKKDCSLLIVGDGPQLEEMKKKAKELALSGKAVFAGSIPHKKLIQSGIYGTVKIFVTASITENQPMTILEAQANGVVCVGADAKGIPDLIHNDVNGYLANPKDRKGFAEKIIRLLSDSRLYAKMKTGTAALVKNHDLKRVVDECEKQYATLIK